MRQICLVWMATILLFASAGAKAQGDTAREYRLGAGDTIKIQVYQNPDLSLETRVSESGTITYPLIGSVNVGGQTLGGAEKVIAEALGKGDFVRQAQVSISLVQVRGNQVVILGQANKPGRYPIETNNMRLTDALALAGGTATGGGETAVITGLRDGKPYRREVDVTALFLEGGGGDGDVFIDGGDTVYIHRAPMYYIYGEVQKPGAYRVERGMTVMQALAQGGGPTLRGSEKSLRLHRRNKDGGVQQITPGKNDLIQADDVLNVPEGWF